MLLWKVGIQNTLPPQTPKRPYSLHDAKRTWVDLPRVLARDMQRQAVTFPTLSSNNGLGM